ncbi:hypothetical protein [Nocardiopsis tropica]|uniref:Lipoprotein n=1 Tax=Nocardiopsis tropica TaxID=109330 RepID=A0ABU7KPS4_9ACTN|nr:hypothetical protein [Nocardiopsis umidischolae]MEE2051305.1 hypothetical protein [Nocardiopsis umidischolae]
MTAAPTACGSSEPTLDGMVTNAEVMCEESVGRELDAAVEISDSQATVAAPDAWTYEATGTVDYEDEAGPVRASYTRTIATDESGEEWTLQDLTIE